jgi:hypothetical protein
VIRLEHTPLLDLRTPLSLIPRAWAITIEPKIVRPSKDHEDFGCWLWDGRVDGNGEPVVDIFQVDKGKRGTVLVKTIVAGLFWIGYRSDRHYVYHECGNKNCLAPHHLLVTRSAPSQFDLAKAIKKKMTSVRDYRKGVLRKEAQAALSDRVEGEINDTDD